MDSIFGIGGTELVLILVIATVVLGPLRMIQLARDFGKFARDLRNYYVELTGNLNEELAALAAEANLAKDINAVVEPQVVQPASGQEGEVVVGGEAIPSQAAVDSVEPGVASPVSPSQEGEALAGSNEASLGRANTNLEPVQQSATDSEPMGGSGDDQPASTIQEEGNLVTPFQPSSTQASTGLLATGSEPAQDPAVQPDSSSQEKDSPAEVGVASVSQDGAALVEQVAQPAMPVQAQDASPDQAQC